MLVVEPAGRQDIEQVARLAAESLSERFSSEWIQEHAAGAGQVVVAREVRTGRILGFAMARREQPCQGHLLALAVDHHHRGRGIGAALLRQVGTEMARSGAQCLCLEVRVDDPAAQAFYLRHGFHPEGLESHVYSDGGDALRLARPL